MVQRDGAKMKRCPFCNHAWNNRVPMPEACPKCKQRLDTPNAPPTRLVIPIAMLQDEKLRHITAIHKFKPEAERTHAHGVQEGWIEALIWLENEVSAAKRRSA